MNSEASSFYQSQTDNFISQHEYYPYVCNDYISSTVSNGVVRLQFQPASQRPVIVVINAVTNSPSHQPYQLLINEGHYRQIDFSADVLRWRAIIDSVEKPIFRPPPLTQPRFDDVDGSFSFMIGGTTNEIYQIEATTNLQAWTVIATNVPGSSTWQDTNDLANQRRFYRLRVDP